ncbi:hypothetical protein CEXT_63001 [Caerostris extrusa]|uniref:Uncharacterized protein n=1 Tax=Caerostris extrusa TaxID=172846 RepID=A0AAV4VMG3_CAEEX|nr:hypothetical protein CEXT_63001 [Caerostris extrusa]
MPKLNPQYFHQNDCKQILSGTYNNYFHPPYQQSLIIEYAECLAPSSTLLNSQRIRIGGKTTRPRNLMKNKARVFKAELDKSALEFSLSVVELLKIRLSPYCFSLISNPCTEPWSNRLLDYLNWGNTLLENPLQLEALEQIKALGDCELWKG